MDLCFWFLWNLLPRFSTVELRHLFGLHSPHRTYKQPATYTHPSSSFGFHPLCVLVCVCLAVLCCDCTVCMYSVYVLYRCVRPICSPLGNNFCPLNWKIVRRYWFKSAWWRQFSQRPAITSGAVLLEVRLVLSTVTAIMEVRFGVDWTDRAYLCASGVNPGLRLFRTAISLCQNSRRGWIDGLVVTGTNEKIKYEPGSTNQG